MNTKRWTALLVAAAMAAAGCSGDDDSSNPTTTVEGARTDPEPGGGVTTPDGTRSPGDGAAGVVPAALGVRLSEGTAAAAVAPSVAVVDGTPLTPEEVAAVLDRLPDWDVPDDDAT
ncbi:MAG: hypothetical protein ABJ314_18550, partial [Ilumatobacter sp.]